MTFETSRYGYSLHLATASVTEAKALITEALKKEGFGILTEIDVKDTLKRKIDKDFREYLILGACNPTFAHTALTTELGIGLLLPCNVCVWADDRGGAMVAMARPEAMFAAVGNPAMHSLVGQVDERLRRALDSIA